MLENRPGLRSQQLTDGTILSVQRGMTDEQAAALYLLAKSEGLLNQYFHESLPSLTTFLKMVVSPSNLYYGCFVSQESSEKVDLVGLVSGTNYTRTASGGKADACMLFLKSVHRHDSKIALEFVEMVLDDAFEAEDLALRALYAISPAKNLASVRFLRRIGFVEYGTAPLLCTWEGEACDAIMGALTREMWYARGTPDQEAADKIRLNGLGTH